MVKKGKLFNGQPMSHWQRKADELVMDCLVRAVYSVTDPTPETTSLIRKLAAERLTAIAKAENPEMYAEICGQRDRCIRNMCKTINFFHK